MSSIPRTSDQPKILRYPMFQYPILDRETDAPLEVKPSESRIQAAVRILTWSILSVCLALWAVIGFLLWIPLLLRSMLQFSLALIDAMLEGVRPVEAGRVLVETVDFYRRGFLVAIAAVFEERPETEKSQRPMQGGRVVREIGWAMLVWYAVLLWIGVVETSPVDLWRGVVEYPWKETLDGLLNAATGVSAEGPVDGPAR